MSTSGKFVVYKSSAGSGKTTTLVREYLKLTLNDPDGFRNVLAITFTNKAANEMKERILGFLRLMASGRTGKRKELADLRGELKLTDEALQQKARTLLAKIIHGYDEFAVSTIDSFVHRIVKTFAPDIKLPQNFEVVIDNDDIIPGIIQELYDKVGIDKDVTNILINFVMSGYEEEKGHDPTDRIYGFIEKQIAEEGFFYIRKLMHLSLADFHTIITKLEKIYYSLKDEIRKTAGEAVKTIHTADVLPEWLYYNKSGIYGYFIKVQTLRKESDVLPGARPSVTINEDKWYGSKCPEEGKVLIDGIKDDLTEKYEGIQAKAIRFLTYGLLHRKIYDVALIREIRQLFDDYAAENQKVHISEFNKKINETISGQPVPFIYERIGNKYRHYLIDEFQDTSLLQWKNFLPLVENSLGENYFNMLVGDAKQAIYRFRNGEVELLANMPKLYPKPETAREQDAERLLESSYKEVILEHNYRSYKEIVTFNNRFFESLKPNLSGRINKVYEKHTQLLPEDEKKKGGYVRIDLGEGENAAGYRENRLELILEDVRQLKEKGYRNKDICILTNKNDYASEIASFLIEKGIDIISNESLLLKNAPEVRMIVAFFKWVLTTNPQLHLASFIRNMPEDKLNGRTFHEAYTGAFRLLDMGIEAVMQYLGYSVKEHEINGLPVYELAEYAVEKFFGKENNNIFLHYFLDFILENQNNGDGSPAAFIDYWDKKNGKAFIILSGGKDAIQIMTIHKAKGLKFEAVIVDLIPKGDTVSKKEYWTDIHIEEIPELTAGMYPVVQDLHPIGLGDIYDEEADKTALDLLNMIYVAFTRPVSALFIVSQKKEKKQNKFTAYLETFIQSEGMIPDKQTFEWGKLTRLVVVEEDKKDDFVVLENMRSSSWSTLVKVAAADEVLWDQPDAGQPIAYGKLVHRLLSEVTVHADVQKVITKYRMAGMLEEELAVELQKKMEKVTEHPELKAYFAPDVLVKTETDLIRKNNTGKEFLRPDRVVVAGDELVIMDYKTGIREQAHIRQIENYGSLFEYLGYRKVKRLLVYMNEEIEVATV
jgi:ATP-dependent exoDNAse (exonuclease V) beta subunit